MAAPKRPSYGKRIASLAMTPLLLLAFAPATALAAPQVLALLATDGPLALSCDDQRCVAELPSLCLQPERRAPEAGRVYRAVDDGALRLTGTAADGTPRTLGLPAEARLSALRTHVAVALSVPRAWVEENFATLEGVRVETVLPLAPEPAVDDTRPVTAAELALATSELVVVAQTVFHESPESVVAARIAGRMINAMGPDDQPDDAALASMWREAGGSLAASDTDADHLARARFDYDFCRSSAASGLTASMKACFQAQHDSALEYLHLRYREALHAGS